MKEKTKAWLEEHIYLDEDTKKPRQIIFDVQRERLFIFAHPLDFDKDDNKVARYWLDEMEGWDDEWFDHVKQEYT